MKKIGIVVINYNGEKDTLEALESLNKCSFGGFEVETIVVDNASEKIFKVSPSRFEKINLVIIRSEENRGFSGGNNLGIKHALENGADYVLLLNNDTLVEEDFLQKLFDFAEKNRSGIFVPKIYFAKGFEFHKDRYKEEDLGRVIWYAGGKMDYANVLGHNIGVDEVDQGQFDQESEINLATGCCMLISRDVFSKIGMLDEKYFLYYEDSDFSRKAIDAGFKIYFVPNSVVWHKNAGSTGGSGSKLQDYYITRNRMYFGMKYASSRAKFALFREGVRNILVGREWQKKGATDYFLGRMGKTNRI